MSGVRFCSCQVIKDILNRTVYIARSPGCEMHGKEFKGIMEELPIEEKATEAEPAGRPPTMLATYCPFCGKKYPSG